MGFWLDVEMENREICKAFLCVYWKSCAIAKCRYTLYSGYVLIELHKLVVICKQRLMEMYIYVYCVERRASDLKREMQQNNIFALFFCCCRFYCYLLWKLFNSRLSHIRSDAVWPGTHSCHVRAWQSVGHAVMQSSLTISKLDCIELVSLATAAR